MRIFMYFVVICLLYIKYRHQHIKVKLDQPTFFFNKFVFKNPFYSNENIYSMKVRLPLQNKVCQLFATGQWFSPTTLLSSTDKTDRYDITEILLKVALNSISISQN